MWAYDESSFEACADVLHRINPAVNSRFATPRDFATWLKSETEWYLRTPGYWGTYGAYVAVCERRSQAGFYAVATLSADYIRRHLST